MARNAIPYGLFQRAAASGANPDPCDQLPLIRLRVLLLLSGLVTGTDALRTQSAGRCKPDDLCPCSAVM